MATRIQSLSVAAALVFGLLSPLAHASDRGLNGWGKAYAQAESRRLEEVRIREETGGDPAKAAGTTGLTTDEKFGRELAKLAVSMLVPGMGLVMLFVD